MLLAWRDQHPVLATGLFVLLYIIATTLSLPGGAWFTVVGGFLFGPVAGTLYVVIAATCGALGLFLVVRYALAGYVRRTLGATLDTFAPAFQRDALSYLLFLRLVPVFPFWLVNIVPALLDVRLRTFLIATVVGIIPGSLIFCLIGDNVGALIDAGHESDLDVIFSPRIFFPLLALAALSLLPVLWRRLHPNGSSDSNSTDDGRR